MNVDNTMMNFTNWLPVLVAVGIMFILIWRFLSDVGKKRLAEK